MWGISPSSRPLAASRTGSCCLISAALSNVFQEFKSCGDTRTSLSSSEQWMIQSIRTLFLADGSIMLSDSQCTPAKTIDHILVQ